MTVNNQNSPSGCPLLHLATDAPTTSSQGYTYGSLQANREEALDRRSKDREGGRSCWNGQFGQEAKLDI